MRVLVCTFFLGSILFVLPGHAEEYNNALTLYWARTTLNNWEEVITPGQLDLEKAWLVSAAYSRRVGGIDDHISFELEGQLVKHYRLLNHWEINGLICGRWEKFWWDDSLDTSAAYGLGLSYATSLPEVEVSTDGNSKKLLAYWMLELAFSLPDTPQIALVGRLHHRSGAYGLIADKGGSNAIGVGLKFRF